MRKYWIFVVTAMLLAGCSTQADTFEYVADVEQTAAPVMRRLTVVLPEAAESPVSETDNCAIYECDGYEICLQTLASGNLDSSIRTLTGFERERLTVMRTDREGTDCYQFVWASGEDQVGRGMVLDDGCYHYCVTVFGEESGEWDSIFDSVELG